MIFQEQLGFVLFCVRFVLWPLLCGYFNSGFLPSPLCDCESLRQGGLIHGPFFSPDPLARVTIHWIEIDWIKYLYRKQGHMEYSGLGRLSAPFTALCWIQGPDMDVQEISHHIGCHSRILSLQTDNVVLPASKCRVSHRLPLELLSSGMWMAV